jgi:Uncharacterised nucleotidyltransferase
VTPLVQEAERSRAPKHILAGLELLQFRDQSIESLATLSDPERQRFLAWCDNRQLTMMLPHLCGSTIPAWLGETIAAKQARYAQRFGRIQSELFTITTAFHKASLPFVMLKGLSHSPALTPHPRMRGQGDIDFWLLGPLAYKAKDLLTRLGYINLLKAKSRHLAPMVRPNEWKWRGDLFDPDMPVAIELHYELWSELAEYITAPGLHEFWDRKKPRIFDGNLINVLCDQDLLGFAALHLLLHLLHGELPLQRAWEIGYFLETHAQDEAFWALWRKLHPAPLRSLEASVFYLVTQWLNCEWREELETDLRGLPAAARSWLAQCSFDPIRREWQPNKSELWFHLALINNYRSKYRVFFRRLLPTSLPGFVDRTSYRASISAQILRLSRQLPLFTKRLIHHMVTFLPTLLGGMRWLWLR